MASAEQKRKQQKLRKKRRNENRRLLATARALTGMTAEQLQLGSINPIDAIQQVLDRGYAELVVASREVDNLKADEIWRDTMVGRIPNEWIRLQEDLKREVSTVAGKMLHLDVESRKAGAAELMAGALAPVLGEIFKKLQLTEAQKAKAPDIVRHELQLLEGGKKAA